MCRYCTMYKCARIKCICTILKQTEQKVSELCDNIYSYTCLSVSLFVSNKRLNRSGPHLVLDLTWPQGRFMDAENVQNYVQKLLIFENSRNNISLSANFLFVIVLFSTKRRCSQKAKSLKRRWALKA